MVDQVGGAKLPSWVVPPEFAGSRLDAFARHCLPHLSRRALGEALAEKLFLLDGRPGRKGDRLVAGNLLVFAGPVDWLAEQPPPAAFELPIVYEDDSILVIDKPAGVATHGFSARDGGTLANWLAARRPALLNVGKSRWEPGLLHRLDVETSGLVLIAKTQAAFDDLRAQFRRREIDKTYLALVWGDADAEGVIDLPLAHDAGDRRRMRVIRPGRKLKRQRVWPALTRYRKLGAARGLSLLEIHMATGVTHQIRVHMAAFGHGIVGDRLYGAAHQEAFGLRRHFLHAKHLEFNHPSKDRALKLGAPLAPELREVLRRLGIKH
jgi:23S rRNA pseudouridine1911/1915/1917 synthase